MSDGQRASMCDTSACVLAALCCCVGLLLLACMLKSKVGCALREELNWKNGLHSVLMYKPCRSRNHCTHNHHTTQHHTTPPHTAAISMRQEGGAGRQSEWQQRAGPVVD